MLNATIPRYKYWAATYANIDPGREGMVIPEAYGDIHNITPVCINTVAQTYKVARRAIKAIDAVRCGNETLTATVDYTADLANGQFTLITTPQLAASTPYWFVLESDYAINGTDYLAFAQMPAGGYAGGTMYYIDQTASWTVDAADLCFQVFVKDSLEDASDYLLLEYPAAGAWTGWNNGCYLRDANARTRVAQSFTTPAGGPWYLSRIHVWHTVVGAPSTTRITQMAVLSSIAPETQIGGKSYRMEESYEPDDWGIYPQRGTESEVSVDIQGYANPDTTLMENVADIIEDVYVNILGGAAGDLDNLAALEAARTQALAIYLNDEITFQQFIEKLEAGQLFKMIPNLAGKYTFQYYESGEPAGTPHFRDEDFISFKSRRDWGGVFQKVSVKYSQNPSNSEYSVREETSDIAKFRYECLNSLTVETYLNSAADAEQLAEDYLGIDGGSSRRVHLQYPPRYIECEVGRGYGFSLIPTQKIKVTKARGDSTTGAFAGVLFRILEIEKNVTTGICAIKAVLDSLTY